MRHPWEPHRPELRGAAEQIHEVSTSPQWPLSRIPRGHSVSVRKICLPLYYENCQT